MIEDADGDIQPTELGQLARLAPDDRLRRLFYLSARQRGGGFDGKTWTVRKGG